LLPHQRQSERVVQDRLARGLPQRAAQSRVGILLPVETAVEVGEVNAGARIGRGDFDRLAKLPLGDRCIPDSEARRSP